jgi:hypothetical protein
VQASEGRSPNFLSQLLRGARESVYFETVYFRNRPPWRAEGSLSRACGEGRSGRGGVGCVHDPEWGSGGYCPNFQSQRLVVG